MIHSSQSVASVWFEIPADVCAVRQVNTEAFSRRAEANLVDALRRKGQLVISLVAEVENKLVGNVVLSPVTLSPVVPGLKVLGLGPVAVLPDHRRKGIACRLIRQAFDQARVEGWEAVVVRGDPAYYTRFGFLPASRFGLEREFGVPDEAFMALELRAGALKGLKGVVRYQPEFRALEETC